MPRSQARRQPQKGAAETVEGDAPSVPPPAMAGSDAVELVLPLPFRTPSRRKAKAAPELVIPLPKPAPAPLVKAKSTPIEELLAPDPTMPPPGKQACLAIMMQSTGHSLDLGCRLCFTNCVYAAPCGCGGWDCIDRKQAEPLVVFTETIKTRSPRRWRKLFHRGPKPAGAPKRVLRVFLPWTWFSRTKT